jgi:hypothetical protein
MGANKPMEVFPGEGREVKLMEAWTERAKEVPLEIPHGSKFP